MTRHLASTDTFAFTTTFPCQLMKGIHHNPDTSLQTYNESSGFKSYFKNSNIKQQRKPRRERHRFPGDELQGREFRRITSFCLHSWAEVFQQVQAIFLCNAYTVSFQKCQKQIFLYFQDVLGLVWVRQWPSHELCRITPSRRDVPLS